MTHAVTHRFHVALVGGGLQNGLIALALLQRRPELSILLVERGPRVGGNHTWCTHSLDIDEESRSFVDPLVETRWPGYEVRFPTLRRTLCAPYAVVSSERFAGAVEAAFARRSDCVLACNTAATTVEAHRVVTGDGRDFHADLVVDARGPSSRVDGSGYQKFVGLEVELAAPHRRMRPLLMDATVPQRGGFRFFYVLPLSPTRALVEDTCFSRDPALDVEDARAEIRRYIRAQGWRVARELRTESGVLPMPWSGSGPEAPSAPLRAGYGGGWFHPATGYSFPVAARLARHVAATAPDDVFGHGLDALSRDVQRQSAYARNLNRMLFHFFEPDQMWNVFERFYRLPETTIQRFYALRLTAGDCARILVGRPPRGLSLRAAFRPRRFV